MNSPTPLPEFLARARARSTLVAVVAGTALVIGGILDRDQFFQSWLLAWLFWLAPALGSLGVVMLHHLTGGSWGFAVRRLLEGASRTLPWMALLFLPVLLGMGSLYEWTHADVVAADPILTRKSAYLNVPFFTLRAGVYFAIWIALARAQVRLAERYDRAPDPSTKHSLQRLSGLGLVLYVSTMTFASVDWVMSLEPHWFSTIYGVHFVVGQVLSTLCLAVVFSSLLAVREPYARWLGAGHFQDLGNLMLAFVLLWAYISFSQFLIVWSGNLPEETVWYLHRAHGGWQGVTLVLAALHFFLPFAFLIWRRTKRDPVRLARLALGLFLLRFVDLGWLVVPAFHHEGLHLAWMDLAALLCLGGIWLRLYLGALRGRPLLSLQDARLQGELESGVRA
jgi:hypothetical protein